MHYSFGVEVDDLFIFAKLSFLVRCCFWDAKLGSELKDYI